MFLSLDISYTEMSFNIYFCTKIQILQTNQTENQFIFLLEVKSKCQVEIAKAQNLKYSFEYQMMFV